MCLIFALFLFCPVTAYAAEYEDLSAELLMESGYPELWDILSADTRNILKELELSETDPQTFLNMSFGDLLSLLWQAMREERQENSVSWHHLAGVVLWEFLIKQLQQTERSARFVHFGQILSVLVLAVVLVRPLASFSETALHAAEELHCFLESFLPVFAAAVSVSGKPLQAVVSQGLLLSLSEFFAVLVPRLFLPLLSSFLAVTLCTSIGSPFSVKGLTGGIRSIISWSLGLIMTIYSAVLMIKGFLAQASDSFALRTGKYLASSLIPVVGKTLSDTASAFFSALHLVQNTIGIFGILILLLLVLPPLLSLVRSLICIKFAQMLSETLGLSPLHSLLEGCAFVLSMYSAILSAYGLMVLVSLALLMTVGGLG